MDAHRLLEYAVGDLAPDDKKALSEEQLLARQDKVANALFKVWCCGGARSTSNVAMAIR